MTDAYVSLRVSVIFSASLLLTLVDSGAIPTCEDKRIEQRLLNVGHSLAVLILLFHVVGRSTKRTFRNKTVR